MMVWPSGFWRAKSVIAIVPPPPDLFSTTVDWPHATCSCCASRRPITSVVPPGAAGTMIRTASVGCQSACAARGRALAAARPAAPDRTARRDTGLVMEVPWRFSAFRFFKPQSLRGRHCGAQAQAARVIHARLLAAENLEHVSEVGELLSARRRPAADVIEDLAVL